MAKRKDEIESEMQTVTPAGSTGTATTMMTMTTQATQVSSKTPALPVSAGKTEVEKAEAAEKRKKKRAAKKIVSISATRKESTARATIKPWKSVFRYNKLHVDAIQNPYVKAIVLEPMKVANDYVSAVDIEVNVVGGGSFSQAQAARTAIARALVLYTKDSTLKQRFLQYDRYMLVEDVRRVEPKKYKGRKARARFQKSYR